MICGLNLICFEQPFVAKTLLTLAKNPIKAIYKCGTKADIEPNVTALKVFYDSGTKNFTEIGIQNQKRSLITIRQYVISAYVLCYVQKDM